MTDQSHTSEGKIEWGAGTPGPYSLTHNSWETSTIYDGNGDMVAEVNIYSWVDEDTQDQYEAIKEADARMFQQAPAMVRILRAIAQHEYSQWAPEAQAILAKIDATHPYDGGR